MGTPTPEELFARWRAVRDPDALGGLFDLAAPGLFRLALSLVPDAATAEDALQETFLFAMEEDDRWDPARPVVPWLAGILRLKVLEVRRRHGKHPAADRVAPKPPPEDPSVTAMDSEERERLNQAIQRLPEPYRGIALLRWRYGLEPAEIADVRGVPPGTVWSLLSRAVRKLKVEMGALPALLLVFRPERGLEGVRGALLRRAAAQAGVSTGAAVVGGGAAVTLGGLLMAKKALVAAGILLLCGGAGWLALRTPDGPETAPDAATIASGAPATPARGPGHVPLPAASPMTEPAGPTVDLSKCDRDLDLFGVVVDPEGTPVPGVCVGIVGRPWACVAGPGFPEYDETVDGPSTLTATDGTFVVRAGPASTVDLAVSKSGFASIVIASCPAGEKVRIVLDRGATVEAVVRDESGKPLAGASLRISKKPKGTGSSYFRATTTDGEGRGLLEGLASGPGLLEASAEGMGRPPARIVQVPASGTLREEFVLPASHPVTGRVIDGLTGSPIAGARVAAADDPRSGVTADAGGGYRFLSWPRYGQKGLTATAPGYAGMTERVTAEGTADFSLVTGDTVTGRILGPDGRPAAGAKVFLLGFLMHPNGSSIRDDHFLASAAEDGSFTIAGVSRGWPHTLRIAAEGRGRLLLDIGVPSAPAGTIDLGDLVLPGSKTVSGTFVDGSGRPFPGCDVWIRRMTPSNMPFADYARARTDDIGRFRFTDVAVGDYRVEARIDGDSPTVQKEIQVTPETERLDVRLEAAAPAFRTGRVEVLVLDPAGKPVPGVTVSAVAEGARPATRTSDARGIAEFTNLATDRVRLHVSPPMTVKDPARFLVPAPIETAVGDPRVVVHLAEASLVRGKVVGPDGAPLSRMSVNAKGPGKAWAGGRTDTKGEFALSMEAGVPFQIEVGGWRESDDGSGRSERTNLRSEPQERSAPAEGVLFVMREIPSGRTLTVRVVDLDGNPMPLCSVLSPAPGNDNTLPYTDRNGKVTLEGLFEEEIRVSAHQPGGQMGKASLPEGTVMPAPVSVIPRGQEITLRLRRGEARTGVVRDAEGRPVENASVTLQTEDYVSSLVWSKADGTFTAWVSPGSRLIRATASSFKADGPRLVADLENDAVPQEGEIVLRLQPYQERR